VLVSFAAVGAASALVLSACSSPPAPPAAGSLFDCKDQPLTCNAGPTQDGGTVVYTIEKVITGWNLNHVDSNTFDFAEVLTGVLANGPFVVPPDFNVVVNPDYASSVEVTSNDPMTIEYNLNPDAVWDDGTPIGLADFEYAWKTLNGRDCPDCAAASTAGYEQISSVTGSGSTITVVFETPYADWKGLFGGLYPGHIAAQQGNLNTPEGLAAAFNWFNGASNVPTFSGGPYVITDYEVDQSVTLEPNERWWGAVKPSLDTLVFRIITDQTAEVPALQSGEVNAIYPQPNQDIVDGVKAIQGVSYISSQGLTWEHLDLNTANPLLADLELRKAIFTAIDREDIIARTVGVFTEGLTPLGSHNFVPGQAGYQDLVTASGQGGGDVDAAKAILTAAGYTGVGTDLKTPAGVDVAIRFSFTQGNTLRQQTGELVQSYLAPLGIDVTLTPISSLGGTLVSGDFDLIIFAWVGGPFPYGGAIQLWGSESESNFSGFNSAESDDLLTRAAQESDSSVADGLLNDSNELLVDAAVVLPLFQKPTFLAAYNNIVNIRDNASNASPVYNVQEWGIRQT
jgi:peptide/nickel transport system substrate-binding protein